MQYLRSDQYAHVSRDCPVSLDLHPVDDLLEITLGEYRLGGDTLRLIVDHPDVCVRLARALDDARVKLANHLYAKANQDSALSRLDTY